MILLVKVLQDFWILSDGGIVMYHRMYDEKMDEQLFGGLLTALHSFAEELSSEGLTSFDMHDKRFTMKKKNTYLFVANSSKRIKEKKVMAELEKISQKFFNSYSEDILNNWDGDVGIFANFDKEIEDSLEETIKKFQKAFW